MLEEIKHLEDRLISHIDSQNRLIEELSINVKELTRNINEINLRMSLEDGRALPSRVESLEKDIRNLYKYLYIASGIFAVIQPVFLFLVKWIGESLVRGH